MLQSTLNCPTSHLNPHVFSSWIISHMISDVPRHIETNSETCFATIRNRTQRVLSVFALWRRTVFASRSVSYPARKRVPFMRTHFIVSACSSVGRRTEIGRERPKQTVHAIESYREVTVEESRHDHVQFPKLSFFFITIDSYSSSIAQSFVFIKRSIDAASLLIIVRYYIPKIEQ